MVRAWRRSQERGGRSVGRAGTLTPGTGTPLTSSRSSKYRDWMAKSKSRAKPRRVSSGSRKAASQPKAARKAPARGRASVGAASKAKAASVPGHAGSEHAMKTSQATLRMPPPVIVKASPSAKTGANGPGPKPAPAAIAKEKGLSPQGPKAPISRRPEARKVSVSGMAEARSSERSPTGGLAPATTVTAATRAASASPVGSPEPTDRTGARGLPTVSPPDASRETAPPPGLPVPIASFTI